MNDKLTPEEQAIFDAWTIAGKVPFFHRRWQVRLQKEWPVLARAILRIVAKQKEMDAKDGQ